MLALLKINIYPHTIRMHLILDDNQKIILPDSSHLIVLVMAQLNRVSSSGTGPGAVTSHSR
jgi:hypothetical protein